MLIYRKTLSDELYNVDTDLCCDVETGAKNCPIQASPHILTRFKIITFINFIYSY